MERSGGGPGGSWDEANKVVHDWLQLLPYCRLGFKTACLHALYYPALVYNGGSFLDDYFLAISTSS